MMDILEEGDPGGPRLMFAMAAAMSRLEADDLGEGTAEPVDTYRGRSSSDVWAKKQTLRIQLVPSLQRRVRYCAGWSQHSNTP
uniref:Uncharacterized protein n=1 Tax=Nymphaea colorata TaxID=210225 RepID=A0A5K0V4T2_9MAGN